MLLNQALGVTVFGLSYVPLVAVPLVVLAYLLVARTRFYDSQLSSEPSTG
ncbi:hypothetical protein [Natronorubrum bangense]|nr:hypothetical protein [Natronorubrum bangense]